MVFEEVGPVRVHERGPGDEAEGALGDDEEGAVVRQRRFDWPGTSVLLS